jgi:hypothetical protein
MWRASVLVGNANRGKTRRFTGNPDILGRAAGDAT